MTEAIKSGLTSTAVAAKDAITVGIEGDFKIDENNELWKGDSYNLSKDFTIVDNIKKATGMEVTIFYGDTRYQTSVLNNNGERVIGTKAAPEVFETVLEKGDTYFAENVDVVGENFFAYYVPLCDSENNPIGMVFTGISQEKLDDTINKIIMSILVVIVAVILIFLILSWLSVGAITNILKKATNVIGEAAEGNLSVEIDEKTQKRKDEVGEMMRSLASLKKRISAVNW